MSISDAAIVGNVARTGERLGPGSGLTREPTCLALILGSSVVFNPIEYIP